MAVPGRGTWETIIPALTAGRHLLHSAGCWPGRHSAMAPTDFEMKESGPQQTRSLRPWTFLCSCSAPSQVNPHRLSQTVARLGRAQSPVTVTLMGFAGTESSVCARLSAALITVIALTVQAIKALGVCGHVCPN